MQEGAGARAAHPGPEPASEMPPEVMGNVTGHAETIRGPAAVVLVFWEPAARAYVVMDGTGMPGPYRPGRPYYAETLAEARAFARRLADGREELY